MIAFVILLVVFFVPLPWEITFAVAWKQLNDRIEHGGKRPAPWVYAGPHFMQPICAIRGECRHV